MEEIPIIDFESYFTRDLLKYAQEHKDIADDGEKFRNMIPHLYEHWLEEGKDFLGGMSPTEYFEKINDVRAYLTMLIEYAKSDMKAPDLLVDCLIDRADEAYPFMVNILSSVPTDDITEEQLEDVKATIIELITEGGLEHLPKLYTALLESLDDDCELGDAITDAFIYLGEDISDIVFSAFENSDNEYAKLCYVDVMSEYSGNKKAAAYIEHMLQHDEKNTPFLVSSLGKIGCRESLPILKSILEDSFIDYFCYSAAKNAIEEIEGEEIPEKDFSGDALFDLLKTGEKENEI